MHRIGEVVAIGSGLSYRHSKGSVYVEFYRQITFRHIGVTLLCLLGFVLMALMHSQVQAAQPQSIASIEQQAQQGDADAQYTLGQFYGDGDPDLGVGRDVRKAFLWFIRAAKQGHRDAQYQAARAYDYGLGVYSQQQVAMYWYRLAGAQGHTLAAGIVKHSGDDALTSGVARLDEAAILARIEKDTAGSIRAVGVEQWFGRSLNIARQVFLAESLFGVTIGQGGKYWSWGVGALAMGMLTFGFWLVIGSTLGVSSSWDRMVRWHQDRELRQAKAFMQDNQAEAQDAMLAAAIEEFGEEAVQNMAASNTPTLAQAQTARQKRVPWQAHLMFLLMLFVGGYLSGMVGGGVTWQWSLGEEFTGIFGSGWDTWAILIFGGMLVGFGTRMSGGCTSGHGLSGCSRLQPGSLVGTAAFFGTAIVVSMLMDMKL